MRPAIDCDAGQYGSVSIHHPIQRAVQWVRADLEISRRHPWLLQATSSRVPIGPHWLAWLEALLRAMEDVGLSGREMISVAFLVGGHARSAAEISLGVTSTPQRAADFERVLQTVIGDSRFPALANVAALGGFDKPSTDEQSHFEFGLQRLLDGLEAFVRESAAPLRARPSLRSRGRRR
jgi:Tetracyclin repressor-like, C-terminal domain